MAEYNVVWFCGLCKERFVNDRREKRRMYCDACVARINKSSD